MRDFLIKKLGLKKLLDKDHLKEFYRSTIDYNDKKLFCYEYYLMEENQIFSFHRMKSYASWQFCIGNPIDLYLIKNVNEIQKITIGNDLLKKEKFIYVVEPNTWFAAESKSSNKCNCSLVMHHIIPSYKEDEDEFGVYEKIIKEIPNYENIAKKFCCTTTKYYYNEKDYLL